MKIQVHIDRLVPEGELKLRLARGHGTIGRRIRHSVCEGVAKAR